MARRATSRIYSTDSVQDAEFKLSMAQTALCETHADHFRRIIALIDHAQAHRVLGDLQQLYPWAFDARLQTSVEAGTITHSNARAVAQRIVDERTLAVHEIEWMRPDTAPGNDADATLRRSRAIVHEDDMLTRLEETGHALRAFEAALRSLSWFSYFTHPSPLETRRSPQ